MYNTIIKQINTKFVLQISKKIINKEKMCNI